MTTETVLGAGELIRRLRADTARLALPAKGKPTAWDEDPHSVGVWSDPELYALCSLADGVPPGARGRVLYQLLKSSRDGVATASREVIDRVIALLLAALPAPQVLLVFQGLKRVRANHKHATRAVVRWILDHPSLADLAAKKRRVVAEVLEHAVGRDVARGAAKKLESAYFTKHFGKLARDPERARGLLAFLYAKTTLPAPREPEDPHALVHKRFEIPATPRPEVPTTVTAATRGDIAANLVNLYRGGRNKELERAIDKAVTRAAALVPKFDGSLAIVLDASGSTEGYGAREFCCIAQSVALRLVLERCAKDVNVVNVGGRGDPPAPEGPTDLAAGVLDAVASGPDVVAVITDGYENRCDGDLAATVAALPGAGIDVPVVVCLSKFTGKDDLTLRRPAPELPELEFWHEADFPDLALGLFAFARGEAGPRFTRAALAQRLARLEKEVRPWTSR